MHIRQPNTTPSDQLSLVERLELVESGDLHPNTLDLQFNV